MQSEGRTMVLALAVLVGSCGPSDASGFNVPASCYAAGTAIEIVGLERGDTLALVYGPQGGQHVYPPVVVRGVDPRTTSVRVELTRVLDGQVVADQVFTRFEPGEGACDVALPRTELFVATPRADGLAASARIVVFDRERTEMRAIESLCVSSEGACAEPPLLALEVNGDVVEPGDHVFLDDVAQLRFRVDPASHPEGAIWGRIGSARVDSRVGNDVVLDGEEGGRVDVQLVLSEFGGLGGGGVIAAWQGELVVGCDVLGDGTECHDSETCDRAPTDARSYCRAFGSAAIGEACTAPEQCGRGATCASGACRAWCDPAAPTCGAGESCVEGLCQPS